MTRSAWAVGVLGAAVAASSPVAAGAQAVISGRVVEDVGAAPVAGTTVALLVGRSMVVRNVVTDEAGAFRLSVPREGRYRLRASRIGLAEVVSAPIDVLSGDTLRVILRMDVQAIRLPALEVVTRSRSARHNSLRLAEFHYRAERGFGRIITQADIEQRRPLHLTHMLAEYGMSSGNVSNREAATGRTSSAYQHSVGLMNRRLGCAPMVYVDDVRLTRHTDRGHSDAIQEAGEVVNMISPSDVYGIEVYPGAASVPGEYTGPTAQCGVILIWTK